MSVANRPPVRPLMEPHYDASIVDIRDSLLTVPVLLIGGWLFVAGWPLAYPNTPIANGARMVDLVFATVLILNGFSRVSRTRGAGSDILTVFCGACLVAAPFAFGYFGEDSGAGLAYLSQIVTGAALIVLGLASLALFRRGQAVARRAAADAARAGDRSADRPRTRTRSH
ncbi:MULTISPECIES: hypothetical protein [unclassified Streptomyces]|uniref:SPW repeat domain-containing protein n=1 Tax=unclassified Streptomyces TaxID=2593676 RepID=UPI00381B7B92